MPAKTAKQNRFLQAIAGGAKPRKGKITAAQAKKALGKGEGRKDPNSAVRKGEFGSKRRKGSKKK